MTDRVRSLTVALDKDTRDDDVEPLINAIEQLRGVTAVTGNVVDGNTYATEMRLKQKLYDDLRGVISKVLLHD